MNVKNMADLRNLIFEVVSDVKTSEKPDLERTRVMCEALTVAVNVIKVQVAYASIVKGDLDLPFMEEPVPEPQRPRAHSSFVDPLTSGPSAEHPWRRVHRLQR